MSQHERSEQPRAIVRKGYTSGNTEMTESFAARANPLPRRHGDRDGVGFGRTCDKYIISPNRTTVGATAVR